MIKIEKNILEEQKRELNQSIENNINNQELEKKQNQFLQTTLGKTINTAIDIGIRALLPDFIDEQVINIKNNLIKNGLKEGINKTIDDAIDIGKSTIGIVTGNFENVNQMQTAVKTGGIIDGISTLLDTVVSSRGKSKACLSTFVERKSRYLIAQVMDDRKSATFNLHCFEVFESISNTLIKTFTVDRGKEFAGYNEIEKRLNIDVYFADPYASWQRGTNENTNGLLREFYPKRFDFSTITQNDLDVVVNIINNRPRKCLGYKTPAEVFVVT